MLAFLEPPREIRSAVLCIPTSSLEVSDSMTTVSLEKLSSCAVQISNQVSPTSHSTRRTRVQVNLILSDRA